MPAIDSKKAEKLHKTDSNIGKAIRARVQRRRGAPKGMARGNQCERNKTAAMRLSLRLKDLETTISRPENRGKDMSGYNTPGSLQFR